VAIAILCGFDIGIGVFPFVVIGAILIWYIGQKTKLPMENLSAVIFAVGVGTSLLFLPINEAEEALVGKITSITIPETLLIIVLGLATFIFTSWIYNNMMLINIHEDLLKAKKKNVALYNLGYLLAIAVTVALGVYLVGGLITATLIAIPAGASRNISKSLPQYKLWAIVFGILGTVVGILLSQLFHYPTGPMIIVSGATIFIISLFFPRN
ncbi:MAG: metal ABC transporter permease, partial [Bacteroidales bacterium]|nr:metal ABC transporter permease [Bacteroidales bacterium]